MEEKRRRGFPATGSRFTNAGIAENFRAASAEGKTVPSVALPAILRLGRCMRGNNCHSVAQNEKGRS